MGKIKGVDKAYMKALIIPCACVVQHHRAAKILAERRSGLLTMNESQDCLEMAL